LFCQNCAGFGRGIVHFWQIDGTYFKINKFKYRIVILITWKEKILIMKGSAEIGNLILDFTSDGKIVNVEFQNISEYLKMMNVNPQILNKLTEVNLIIQKQKGAISLFAVLKTPTLKQPVPLAIVPVTKQLAPSI
jgi:hypothetical protein